MFKPTKATSIEEYIALIEDDERRSQVAKLHAIITRLRPDLTAHFASNMIGYGSFSYKNYKKQNIDWPFVALASQKNYISIYVCAIENGEYVAERFRDQLGSVSIGKSCIRFKKLSDLDMSGFEKLLQDLDVQRNEMASN